MKVSIITATYNSEKSIQRTIDSVAAQDYANIEHIIIDGGSTDNTVGIIKINNCKISSFVSERDKGIYDALNKGINLSSGDIIGFLNSDDVYTNSHVISRIVNCFKIKNTDLVYGNLVYQSKNEENKKTIRYWRSNVYSPGCLKYGWMPPHPTLYCKREVYEKWGLYNENFKISSDYEFILRIFKQPTVSKAFLPTIIVKMDVGGVSNNSLKNIVHKTKEDYKAIRLNKVGGILTVLFKNFRKLGQFNRFNHHKLRC
ncbi:MAG: glycosyltransferase [Paludibacter sp.]|nr:glycosyltransferase [Paludibacter sp.]